MVGCDQVGAYVVDALTDDERARFATHLVGCDSCRHEVREFSETTAALAAMVATPPPPALRAQVLAQVAQIRPLPPLDATAESMHSMGSLAVATPATPVTPIRSYESDVIIRIPSAPRHQSPQSPNQLTGFGGSDPSDESSNVVDLDQRRTGRRGFLRWGVAAAAVGVVGLGAAGTVSGWRAASNRGEAMTAQKELLSAPDAELVAFSSSSGNDVKGSYLVSRQQNRAMFVAERMPTLPKGKVFQQWTLVDASADAVANATANVTFDSIADAVWLTGDIAQAGVLAISIENTGGAKKVNTKTILGTAKL